jgi:RNase P subunit RPR2
VTVLPAGKRWRCGACGNLTRFDVESVQRLRQFWHFDLSGESRIEEAETLDVDVVAVVCRWCGARDAIEVVDAPAPP